MSGVELAKIVREFRGWNPWEMHKAMKKKTVQAYLSLERSAQRITLADLETLESLYIEGGGTAEDFKKLQRKCAKKGNR